MLTVMLIKYLLGTSYYKHRKLLHPPHTHTPQKKYATPTQKTTTSKQTTPTKNITCFGIY